MTQPTFTLDKAELEKIINDYPGNAYQKIKAVLDEVVIDLAIIKHRGNQTQAAETLGINRGTLRKKLKQNTA